MESDSYLTIKTNAQGTFRDRKSRFEGFVFPVKSDENIKEILKEWRKKYFDATHHCYAYIIGDDGNHYRANDDGEPSGSAGLPILGQIKSNGLTDILVIVVRYYGGVKLGVSGLINAYKQSAALAIANSEIITCYRKKNLSFQFAYSAMNDIMKIIKQFDCEILSQDYTDVTCNIAVIIRKSFYAEALDLLNDIEGVEIQ